MTDSRTLASPALQEFLDTAAVIMQWDYDFDVDELPTQFFVLEGGPDDEDGGFTLCWGDGLLRTSAEWFNSLPAALLRMAVVISSIEQERAISMAERFAAVADEFLRTNTY